jgi:peroxiredoxin
MSLPETQSVFSRYGGKGLTVMGIDGESKSAIKGFVDGAHYTFPAYEDADGSAGRAYGADAIPTLAIIDKNGNLSSYFVGLQQKETVEDALKKAGVQ